MTNNSQLSVLNPPLPKGWEVKKLGEVCEVIAGQSPAGKYYNNRQEGLPFYQGKKQFAEKHIAEPTKWTTKVTKEAIKNDILMSVRAPVGPINIATQKICIGRGLASIRAGKLINREFLYDFLIKHENEIVGNTGAVFNSINKKQIEAIQIPLPPLPEQQRIVKILDKAFVAIDKAKQNAEQNLRNAKEVFQSKLQSIFDNGKLKVENGEWEKHTLKQVCEITSKLVDPKESQYQDMVHIGAGNIVAENGALIDLKTAREEELISGKFVFDKSMVLYSKIRPYLMKIVKCDFKGLCSADIYPLTPLKDKITKSFLYYLLYSSEFTRYAIEGSQRAGMPKVNRSHLFNYSFYCPSLTEQEQLSQSLDKISAEIDNLAAIYQQKLANLDELKKSILQKAFRGEL